jgi:LuxR family maltose regulon positive regulatory protein
MPYQGKVKNAMEVTDEILKYSRKQKIKLKLVQASLFKIKMIYDDLGKKREIINLFRGDCYGKRSERFL